MNTQNNDFLHRRMQSIHSKDTKPEMKLRKELWKRGIHYRKNYKILPGSPDIVITKYKIAIFCDGEYFHGKDWEQSLEKKILSGSNSQFWIKKITRNMARDVENNKELTSAGWKVYRFWANDIMKNVHKVADCIEDLITECQKSQNKK